MAAVRKIKHHPRCRNEWVSKNGKCRYSNDLRGGKQWKKRCQELNHQIWQQLRASVLRAEEIATSIMQLATKEERVDKEHVEDNLLNEAMGGSTLGCSGIVRSRRVS